MGHLGLRDHVRRRRSSSGAGSPTCSGDVGCSSPGSALFAASSLLCGLAWSEASLIAFRALQGLGGALLAPAALSLLMTTFAEGRERNLALGIYGAASGSGAAVGVLLGGVLTSYLSWSWIFFINVPVGLAAIAPHAGAAGGEPRRHGPRGTSTSRRRLGDERADAARLRDDACDDRRLGRTAHARPASPPPRRSCSAFVAIELRSPAPLLPLRIFRSRSLTARERGDGDRRRRRVLGVLPADPLPAGRAPLLGDGERRRLHRLRARRRRRLERGAGCRRPLRRPADPHSRACSRARSPWPG